MYNIENLKPLAEALPEDVKENALDLLDRMGTVIEGIGDRDIEWHPTLMKLVQGTTDRSNLPKGTAIGSLLLGEEVVDAPFRFIPLRLNVGRQYWDPDQNNKRMLCQSPDAKMGFIGQECKSCPKAVWVEGEGAECSKVYQLLAISEDLSQVFTINFAKTNYKVGAEMEQTLRKAGVAPYMRVYGLSSETSTKVKNVEMFKIEVLKAEERRTKAEYLAFLKALFDQVTDSRKQLLTNFYEAAVRRQEQKAISMDKSDESGADSTLALEVDESSVVDVPSTDTATEAVEVKKEKKAKSADTGSMGYSI